MKKSQGVKSKASNVSLDKVIKPKGFIWYTLRVSFVLMWLWVLALPLFNAMGDVMALAAFYSIVLLFLPIVVIVFSIAHLRKHDEKTFALIALSSVISIIAWTFLLLFLSGYF